ncbi:Na+-dependent transporter [Caulobacter sp. 17J65-9]|uniref:Na+-dependent transporter n=1 Tax=Caulobacter sp. 17J65-9 TaxID=2709382 RepID=UPI0013C565F7|nr:Na+-dependent transporter [Caulobacter sp. 17J65-9]
MELLKELLPLVLAGSLALTVVAMSMGAGWSDVTYVVRRPMLLLRSVVAIYVVVPVLATIVVKLMPLTPQAALGIMLMSVAPVGPFLLTRELKLGAHKQYVYGLFAIVSLLSIVLVPLTVALASWFFGVEAAAPMGKVASSLATTILIPLAIGMAVHHWRPAAADRLAPKLLKAGLALLVLGALPLLFVVLPATLKLIGDGTVLAMLLVVTGGLLAGHFLAGPDLSHSSALAISTAARQPGLALLIAKSSAGLRTEHAMSAVLLFFLIGSLVTMAYQVWAKRRLKSGAPP